MSATPKDMDQQFADIDQEILEDAPLDAPLEKDKFEQMDAVLAGTDSEDNLDKGEGGEDEEEEENLEDAEDSGEDETQENAEAIDYTKEFEVKMPYGMETLTIGELKDRASQQHLKEVDVQKRENEVMRDQTFVDSLVNSLGPLPPETVALLEERKAEYLVRETRAMQKAIPEWDDKQLYIKDDKTMLSLAQEYGYSEDEYRGVGDHRLIKMTRDFALLKARVEGARANPKRKLGKKQPAGRKLKKQRGNNEAQMIDAARNSNNQAVKQAAIAKLLE